MDFLKYFSYYSQKMMISPYYFGRIVCFQLAKLPHTGVPKKKDEFIAPLFIGGF
jgi:hypothetical protein